jgi:MarR family
VDTTQAWRVTRRYTRTAAEWTAKEASRRKALRAKTRPLVADARKALAEARKADPDRTRGITHRAERELRAAQRRVPDALWLFASKAAIGAGVAAYVGLPLVPARFWWWSAVGVAAVAAGTVAWLAARTLRRPSGLQPTAEERQLLARLEPEHWAGHCETRGLAGTLTGRPELTASGVTVDVRLDGTWTAGKLRGAEEHVRALLGCRTDLRIEITAGKRGGWAVLTLRTRSAADGDDLLWHPDRTSFGVDTITGNLVTVPLGERLLIAGRSGAGKSVASRPLLYDASEGATNALVILDLKRVEGRLWDHRARVAMTPAAVVALVEELVEEMHRRLDVLPKGKATWTPTPDRPRITVVVDEGAEIVTAAKAALEGLETIARMGRAACIDLWWMTQKPTIGDGIPRQIAPQVSTSICLAVKTPAEARVVLGEDAQAKGWNADELPAPGVALVRDGKRKPHPIRVRYMDDATVIGLPDRRIWSGAAIVPDVDQAPDRPRLTVVKDTAVPAPRPALEGADARITDVLAAVGRPLRQKEIVVRTGLVKGTVSKTVGRLVEAGHLTRTPDGLYAVATEATA